MSEANRLPPWLAANTSATSHAFNQPFWRQVLKVLLILVLVTGGVGAVGWGLARLVEYSQVPVCWQPNLNTIQPSPNPIFVDVSGEVEKPGVYQLQLGQRMDDAVELAGGLTAWADQQFISQQLNLSTVLEDGQKVYIPAKQLQPTSAPHVSQPDNLNLASKISPPDTLSVSTDANQTEHAQTTQTELVSLNQASQTELETLHQVGEKRAAKIIENRPFLSIAELVDKKILSQSVFDKIKKQISL